MQIDEDEYERRLRLVLLTHEVLKDIETPTDEATSAGMFFLLSRAFFDKDGHPGEPRSRQALRDLGAPLQWAAALTHRLHHNYGD